MKTEKELRELDAWIGIHVFGKKAISRDGPKPTKGTEDDYFVIEYVDISHSLPRYTSGENFQELLERCCVKLGEESERCPVPEWLPVEEKWRVVESDSAYGIRGEECSTLPLALVKFAKKLFEK
jgi:hypothetical protein